MTSTRLDAVRHLMGRACSEALAAGTAGLDRLALIRELEDVKSLAAAVQAEVTVAFDRRVQAERAAQGEGPRSRVRGIAAEVALARRESPHRGGQLLSLGRVLVEDLPHTLSAVSSGRLSEYRAWLIARETACLSREDRAVVDAELCGDPDDPDRIASWGNGRIAGEARKIAYRLDPEAYAERAAKARADRHVSVRPAPDVMSWFTALLPVEHGVAVRASLGRLADAAVASGDPRSRGQLMADGLVEKAAGPDLGVERRASVVPDPTAWGPRGDRGCGQDPGRTAPNPPSPPSPPSPLSHQPSTNAVPVAVNLTVSDETLLGGGAVPAWVEGYGPVPAQIARDLVARAEADARASLRRLYLNPATGALTAVDSVARTFPTGLARFIVLRDQTCRTPWCDAPIRQIDHVVGKADGGPTAVDNGQGLCVRCNLDKQATGWQSRPRGAPPARHRVDVISPQGQRATSRAPDLPAPSDLERHQSLADPWLAGLDADTVDRLLAEARRAPAYA